MARLARTALAGIPYRITHRGNRRGEVFLGDADRRRYLAELGLAAPRYGLKIWGWCPLAGYSRNSEKLEVIYDVESNCEDEKVKDMYGWDPCCLVIFY